VTHPNPAPIHPPHPSPTFFLPWIPNPYLPHEKDAHRVSKALTRHGIVAHLPVPVCRGRLMGAAQQRTNSTAGTKRARWAQPMACEVSCPRLRPLIAMLSTCSYCVSTSSGMTSAESEQHLRAPPVKEIPGLASACHDAGCKLLLESTAKKTLQSTMQPLLHSHARTGPAAWAELQRSNSAIIDVRRCQARNINIKSSSAEQKLKQRLRGCGLYSDPTRHCAPKTFSFPSASSPDVM
jgi:hypothetical protein